MKNSVLSYPEYCQEIDKEIARHKRKCQKLKEKLKAFQSTCKHEKTDFESDPSGGSDSYTYCTVCKKVM